MHDRQPQYELVLRQAKHFSDEPADMVSLLANITALLHYTLGFWWTGIYRVAGDELVLSTFQGPVACTNIPFGKGVCGTAWKEQHTIIVPDVEQFPGHIACSTLSRSEIVVPMIVGGKVWAVLDIDSKEPDNFYDTDRQYLELLAEMLSKSYTSLKSPIRDIYLAGGCFWGTQHYLSLLRGVLKAEAGYANGNVSNPTYEQVYTDTTGFAETVYVRYDSSIITLSELLGMYFKTIDPTLLNRQGGDHGTRYRTGIYFTTPDDLPVIRQSVRKIAIQYSDPIVVEVSPLTSFYIAEDYHQDYLKKHPDGYCHIPWELMSEAKKF